MTAGHAELSGSTSGRWIRCPGSVRMTRSLGESGGGGGSSQYAREGTFAHAIAAHILGGHEVPDIGTEFLFEDHGEEVAGTVTEEMIDHVMVYVDHVRKHGGILMIEQHVDLSSFVRDEMWGTGDAIIVKEFRELVICDFKYGYYPVHLIDWDLLLDDAYGDLGHINSQLLYYAAGAANICEWKHEKITLEIVQPRCMEVPDVQSITIDKRQLKKWAEEDLWRAAHLATSEDAPLVAGDWCRFCPALSICPEARNVVQNAAMKDFAGLEPKQPDVPDNSIHVMEIMRWAPIIDAWLRAIEEHALQLMRRGVRIPGFKLVEKRANRHWREDMTPEEIFRQLKAAGGKGQLKHFLETKFVSPARAEKIAGKKAVNNVCIHPRGDLTVAAESDRRPAVNPTSDFEEFAS